MMAYDQINDTCWQPRDKPLPRPLHIWPRFVSQTLLVIQLVGECQPFFTSATVFISHISFEIWHPEKLTSLDSIQQIQILLPLWLYNTDIHSIPDFGQPIFLFGWICTNILKPNQTDAFVSLSQPAIVAEMDLDLWSVTTSNICRHFRLRRPN